MFDIWLMLGSRGRYVFKKVSIPLAPFHAGIGARRRAEDAFRLSMIGSGGDMKVFWSNGLVGSITTLAIVLLFWPVIGKAIRWRRNDCGVRGRWPGSEAFLARDQPSMQAPARHTTLRS